jgi:Flp pilus assembly protein TadD
VSQKQRRRTRRPGPTAQAQAGPRRARGVDPDALHARAIESLRDGRMDVVETTCRQALRAHPDHAPCLHLLGVALGSRGDFDGAVTRLRAATELHPRNAEYEHNLGIALLQQGDLAAAEDAFVAAVDADPSRVEAVRALVDVQRQRERPGNADLGRLDVAVSAYRRLLLDDPDDVGLLTGLGAALEQQGRLPAAEAVLRRALDNDPTAPGALSYLGIVLRLRSHLEEALECFHRRLALAPGDPGSIQNIALTLADKGDFDDALMWYGLALERDPDAAQVRFNRACARLASGDLERGWDEFEFGFDARQRTPLRNLPAPRWDGEDISDKTILLWREQGIGDELLTASCFRDVIDRAGHVIVESSWRLESLLARSFPGVTVRAESLSLEGEELVDPPDYDVHIPVYSLPRLLRRSFDDFPRDPSGYLRADADAVARWRERLDAVGPGLRVGMSWRSRNVHGDRAWYYTKLHQWGPLFEIPGIQWVLLQYDDCEREVADAESRFGVKIHRWNDIDLMIDLDDVAALTSALDVVVTPATSVGHMCGALGVDTLQLEVANNSTALGRTDTYPWMPSVQLFVRNWDEGWERVIDEVATALRERVEHE